MWKLFIKSEPLFFTFVFQNVVKENLKNKRTEGVVKTADGAADVAKVEIKVESRDRGEGCCLLVIYFFLSYT